MVNINHIKKRNKNMIFVMNKLHLYNIGFFFLILARNRKQKQSKKKSSNWFLLIWSCDRHIRLWIDRNKKGTKVHIKDSAKKRSHASLLCSLVSILFSFSPLWFWKIKKKIHLTLISQRFFYRMNHM